MEYIQAQDGKRYRYRKFTGFHANFETLTMVGHLSGGKRVLLGEYGSREELDSVMMAQMGAEEQGKLVFIFPPKDYS